MAAIRTTPNAAIRTTPNAADRPSIVGSGAWLLIAAGALVVLLCLVAISSRPGLRDVTDTIDAPPSGLDHLSRSNGE